MEFRRAFWREGAVFLFVLVLGQTSLGTSGSLLTIGNHDDRTNDIAPYFFGTFDAAGFSDAIYYGSSPEHPTDQYNPIRIYHELLSGEWAAAIYYDGIETDRIDPDSPARKAMWLTQMFDYPDWYTGSDFTAVGTGQANHNSNNPSPKNNTAYSTVANNEVKIKIDYEVVDLDALESRSPLGFLEPDATDPNLLRSAYVESDRYIFMQTYTITNIADHTLNNIAFYQMLHSHGADEYDAYVSSTYLPIAYPDPLEDYAPYDPNHCAPGGNTAGNFAFDITQWNHETIHTDDCTHKDWVGFSCSVEPDWIDNDIYEGGHWYAQDGYYKPRRGTHINIENRALNGEDHLYWQEVAGAVGWNLRSLDPNETAKRTVAFMFCDGNKTPVRHNLYVIQTDDVATCFDATDPDAEITYTLAYGNANPGGSGWTEYDLVLTAHLPTGTYPFDVQVSDGGSYDWITNTATWTIGTLNAGASGQRTVTTKFSDIKSGSDLVSKAVLRNAFNLAQYTLKTPVCDTPVPDVLYVDKFAPGLRDGSDWYNACHDLQEALERVRSSGRDPAELEIRMANGIYKPGLEDTDSFRIPAGLKVYGGYAGHGAVDPDERNWKTNKTILSGFILSFPTGYSVPETYRNKTVVTMGQGSLLDGVTVEEAGQTGIEASGVTSVVSNCAIKANLRRGINCEFGNLTVKWCEIHDNGWQGIYHTGNSYSLTIENCKIYSNYQDGILIEYSKLIILNSLVYENGFGSLFDAYYGINLTSPSAGTTIRNNTIVENIREGIGRSGGVVPGIRNNILYFNNNQTNQLAGVHPSQTTYNCISDCNDINNEHNFNDLPGFVYAHPDGTPRNNNYHLAGVSRCINSGDGDGYTEELDIDGDPRVYGVLVDRGADEVACDDISHVSDLNADGIVNFEDFALLSAAWLSHDPNNPAFDPNDPASYNPNLSDPNHPDYITPAQRAAWNVIANLDDTGGSQYAVDLDDLIAFCENNPQSWLWIACWNTDMLNVQTQQMMTPAGGGEESLAMESAEIEMQAITEEEQPIIEEKSIEEQIIDLQDAIAFLENLWLQEPDIQQEIDLQSWQEFMNAVYQSMVDLESLCVQNEPLEQ